MMNSEDYKNMEGEKLPYTTAWGFTLDEIEVACPDCEKPTSDPKFRLTEFTNSLDVNGVGICYNCKSIVTSKPMRIYRDGRVTWRNNDGQWVERVVPLSEKFRKWVKKWLCF